jgi:hypothetical protein
MREIYTYFDASLGLPDQGEVIFHWHSSWQKHGWTPRMLTPLTWRSHPQKKAFKKALKALELTPIAHACLMRLLALNSLDKSVFLCDYDVINFGLGADSAWLMDVGGAGFGWFSRESVQLEVDDILESSCYLSAPAQLTPICTPYGGPGWQSSDLVHFSSGACDGTPKHRAIETCGLRY